MDKYEYKVRSEEIKLLIAQGAYVQAAEIADTIDWRRVKSVMMLCTVGDLYKVNRRYEDAKNMLLLAYDKKPGGRTICYSLCELCIKTEEFVQAVSYYNEFMRVAPKDPERYILQYKLYEAQNVNLEERIGVLEELKKRDYREKWAYELAYLYHRVGLAARCVEECDELILWFGEGKYVVKAMELKMLHQPLTPSQQEIYDHRFDPYVEPVPEQYAEDPEMQDYDGQDGYYGEPEGEPQPYEGYGNGEPEGHWEGQDEEFLPEEMDIQVKTMDVGKYNTINLQEELAAGLQEVLGADDAGSQDAYMEPGEYVPDDAEMEGTEVFFGETGEIEEAQLEAAAYGEAADAEQGAMIQGTGQVLSSTGAKKNKVPGSILAGTKTENIAKREPAIAEAEKIAEQKPVIAGVEKIAEWEAKEIVTEKSEDTAATVMNQMREETFGAQPPKELADVLLQESDGQIRMVLPERAVVEKQLTGQMNIEDILSEWEQMKRENEEKCKEEVRQHVLRETGPMFTEFEAAVRDGLLGQLEDRQQERPVGVQAENAEKAAGYMENLASTQASEKPAGLEEAGYREGAEAQDEPVDDEETGYWEGAEVQGDSAYVEEPGYWEGTENQEDLTYTEEAGYWEGADAQENPAYVEETGNWEGAEVQGDPSYAEETGNWEGAEVQGDPSYAEETGNWEGADAQENPVYVEETGNWEGAEVQGDQAYAEETGNWEGTEAQEESVNAEETGYWEGAEVQEDPSYAEETGYWEGAEAQGDPAYVEEAGYWEGTENQEAFGYMEGQEYTEWTEGQEGTFYAEDESIPNGLEYGEEAKWSEEQTGTEHIENVPEGAVYGTSVEWNEESPGLDYIEEIEDVGESDNPEYEERDITEAEDIPGDAEDTDFEEEGEKSEALDYLEALEHVEEAELLEEQESDASFKGTVAAEKAGANISKEDAMGKNQADKDGKVSKDAHKPDEPLKGSDGHGRAAMERDKAKVRSMTREEKELFAPFIQSRQSGEQLVKALDGISMAAYTGNVVITGEEGMDTLTLAKNMIREVRMTDSNFSGKVAKVTGAGLNRKNVKETLEGLNNGALIIEKASGMDSQTAGMLHVALQQEKFGIIVILEDTKKAIQKLFLGTPQLFGDFTARVDLEALSNDTLVSFGRRYAREKEYSIDDLGMLALHTRIEESQTIDHVVTVIEVKQIVDEAIRHANKKTLGHFFDILLARRYDDEDMIILTEKDFGA